MGKCFEKLMCGLLVIALLSVNMSAMSTSSGFSDVSPDSYYYNAVKWAVENEITQGTTATTFSPNKTCTIANVVTFLWRASGTPEPTIANPFSDVKSGAYYWNAAIWAYQGKLVVGSEFKGDTPCTREIAVYFLWRMIGSPQQGENKFSDVDSSSNYVHAINWAANVGITTGTSKDTFSPNNVCTRAQIVTFMHRVSERGYTFALPQRVFSPLGENFILYLAERNGNALIDRTNFAYMTAVKNYQTDVTFLMLLNAADGMIGTGTKPDKNKYIEVLTNLIGFYELENAGDFFAQKKSDNLKSVYDYGMDLTDILKNAASVMLSLSGASPIQQELMSAINGTDVLLDNIDSWITEVSKLEVLMQDYTTHDEFLALIENNSNGDLKEAAISVRTGLKESMKTRLNAYKNVAENTLLQLGEYIYSDYAFEFLKRTSTYANDEATRFFVDCGDKFVHNVLDLKSAWDLGRGLGKLFGNLVIGGENLINRVMEMMALYDISLILQSDLLALASEFYEEGRDDTVLSFVSLAQYLTVVRVRGEYCIYNVAAVDGGLLTWFQGQYGDEAKAWYEKRSDWLFNMRNRIREILHTQTVAEQNQDLLMQKMEELISASGIVEQQLSWEVKNWTVHGNFPTGIISANIADFDMDGSDELLVCYSYQDDHLKSSYIRIEIYEAQSDSVHLVANTPFAPYSLAQDDFGYPYLSNTSEEYVSARAIFSNERCYIICESHDDGLLADGHSENYWIYQYKDGRLNYVASFTQTGGGSSDFEYTGFDFADGKLVNSALLYQDYSSLEDFDTAISTYFRKYDLGVYTAGYTHHLISGSGYNVVDLFLYQSSAENFSLDSGSFSINAYFNRKIG